MPEATRTGAGAPGYRFEPYPAYKDSGVEWLGEIPGALGGREAQDRQCSADWYYPG